MRLTAAIWLVAMAVAAAQTPTSRKPTRHALIVSNSKYSSLPALPASAAEAKLVEDALTQAGFEITPVHDFKQKDFFGNFEKSFLEKVQPGDICLFYYSGYAVQVAGDDSYLLPVDFDPNSSADMEIRAIRLQRLPEDFEDRKAGVKIIVVEAPKKLDVSVAGTTTGLMSPSLTDLRQTLFAFAAQPRKNTAPPPPDGVGWFSRALAKQMNAKGVHLRDVFAATENEVRGQTKEVQDPLIIGNVSEEFYFHLPEKAPEPPKPVPVPPVTKNEPPQGVPSQNGTDKQNYVWIPPGHFKMGCVPKDTKCEMDEKPQHPVTLTKGFWMGQTEVTVTAYIVKFLEANKNNKKLKKPTAPLFNTGWRNGSQPVVDINWDEAKQFCEWAGGRLPTEAEWEYAARGGVEDEINGLGDKPREKANFYGKGGSDIYDDIAAPVAQFDANRFKLYDMLGNVWEWVSDSYSPTYYMETASGVADPRGPDKGKDHVTRGGSFVSDPDKHMRLSIRKANGKDENNVGMRCVLEESPATKTLLGR